MIFLHPKAERISSLIMKAGLNTISDQERKELNAWINESEGNRETMEEIIRLCSPDYTDDLERKKKESIEKILDKIQKTENGNK